MDLVSPLSHEKKKKIPFFHLGPKNNWQKNFDNEFTNKLNNIFEKNLKIKLLSTPEFYRFSLFSGTRSAQLIKISQKVLLLNF